MKSEENVQQRESDNAVGTSSYPQQSNRNRNRNRQPHSVKNDAPGYGDKKLEGPNRPST